MKLLVTQNRAVEGIGNGAVLQPELWNANTDTFVKNIGTSFESAEGAPFSLLVNTDDPSGTDFIPAGANHTIKLNDGAFPSVAATPENFEMVDPNITNYPAIPWFNGGAVFHAGNLVWNDAAATIPAELYETDPVAGVIGAVTGLDISAAPSSPDTFVCTQSTSSKKPMLKLDAQGYVYLDFGAGSDYGRALDLATVSGNPITNDSTLSTKITCEVGDGNLFNNWTQVAWGLLVRCPNATDFTVEISGNQATVVNKQQQKVVIELVKSKSAAFGETKVFVDGVEVLSVPIYYADTPANHTGMFRRNGNNSPALKVYGFTYEREGILNPSNENEVHQWHKDIGGIA